MAIVMVNFQYEIISQCYKRLLMRKETMKVSVSTKRGIELGCFLSFTVQLHLSTILE